ncbi:MAG: hypothetical protein QNJ29_14690 [Rhizobiaceae bacterium]|nr:hypothetical protein [Rhizobiaceae bacterium]
MRCISILIIFAIALLNPVYAQNASDVPADTEQVPNQIEEPKAEQGAEAPEIDAAGEGPMTMPRMAEIIRALDGDAVVQNRAMQLTIADVTITIVADPLANRMRAFSAFKTLDGVDGQQLYRMMQANFDAALDARYAVAKGHVLSVFIHPLAELQKDQLIEGLGQVVNLVKTFGTAYTSGAMTFGGGDSRNLHRELIDDLLKKGEEI